MEEMLVICEEFTLERDMKFTVTMLWLSASVIDTTYIVLHLYYEGLSLCMCHWLNAWVFK